MDTASTDSPVDFTEMDDAQVDAVRVAALAEITARGERFQYAQQVETLAQSLKNRSYSKDDVAQLFAEVVEKVFPDAPPQEPSV